MKSIVSYKNRGTWGKSSYRGNCSGHVHKDLIEQFHVKFMSELFAGSGTGAEVCEEKGIRYIGADLNPNFVHKNIIGGFNAIEDDVPEAFLGSELLFMHPLYGKEIGIAYAGSQWDASAFEKEKGYHPRNVDLGQMPWSQFMRALNKIVMKFYAALDTGARMAILMGDVKRNGRLYSMLRDIIQPGILENIVIKTQHNCVSDERTYTNCNFIPIVHEYIMIVKKLIPFSLDFSLNQQHGLDIRDSKDATWRDVVCAAMRKLGGTATLQRLYSEIDGHRKCALNPHWKEKVRQILQQHDNLFCHVDAGIWRIKEWNL